MATVNYDYSFTPNTAAKATEVNGNFNKIKEFAEGISTGANLDAGSVTSTKILNGSIGTDKLASNAVTNTKIDFTSSIASGGLPRIVVSATEPTTVKAGDVWIQI